MRRDIIFQSDESVHAGDIDLSTALFAVDNDQQVLDADTLPNADVNLPLRA
jgi:hypothetical protein